MLDIEPVTPSPSSLALPRRLHLELTNRCNSLCTTCVRTTSPEPERDMEIGEARRITSGLPDEAATSVLAALASASDLPIGDDADYARAHRDAQAAGVIAASPAQPGDMAQRRPKSNVFKLKNLIWIAIFAYFFFRVVRKMMRN